MSKGPTFARPSISIGNLRPRLPLASVVPTGFRGAVGLRLPEVIKRLAESLNPHKIVLFGSYAYGRPTPDSDVDLLIIMDTSADSTERYLAVSRVIRPRPFPVDILVKTPDEIRDALARNDFFIDEIITRGIVLYERAD